LVKKATERKKEEGEEVGSVKITPGPKAMKINPLLKILFANQCKLKPPRKPIP